jgi:hypothetical protein
MRTHSNNPLPTTPQLWKNDEYIIYVNHKDNGVQPEEKTGQRYEAEITIVREQTMEKVVDALTRMTYDPTLDQKVIDNIEVNGGSALNVINVYPQKVLSTIFPVLPSSGNLKKGEIYSYNNGAVMVVQDHARTIYEPELTPALFSFYREVNEGKEWIVGEKIELNATRTYNGKTYKCIQAHQSQLTWNPELTLGTLWQVVATSSAWTVGVAYKVNDVVTYQSKTYKCLQAHTSQAGWTPSAVPALWLLQ